MEWKTGINAQIRRKRRKRVTVLSLASAAKYDIMLEYLLEGSLCTEIDSVKGAEKTPLFLAHLA